MKTKHTPGEWEVKRINNKFCQLIRTKYTKFYVAELHTTGEEADANAKLIATAPETLQALIEIKEYIERMGKVSMAMQMIKIKAKEAIKKATE